jgi:hypothetical protein
VSHQVFFYFVSKPFLWVAFRSWGSSCHGAWRTIWLAL